METEMLDLPDFEPPDPAAPTGGTHVPAGLVAPGEADKDST